MDVPFGGDTANGAPSGAYDPFTLRDALWTRSFITTTNTAASHDGDELFAILAESQLPPLKLETLSLELPPLDLLSLETSDEPLENLDASVSSLSRSTSPELPNFDLPKSDTDLWTTAASLGPLKNEARVISWDAFVNPNHEEPTPIYISEAGDEALDLALEIQARNSGGRLDPGTVVKSDILLSSLCQLALGRPSTLFPFNQQRTLFQKAIDDMRLSGHSLELCQSFFFDVSDLGAAILHFKAFCSNVYSDESPMSSFVTLANITDVAITAIERLFVWESGRSKTLLQIQSLISPAKSVIHILDGLLGAVKNVANDAEALSNILEKLQYFQDCDLDSNLLVRIAERMIHPWLERIFGQLVMSKTSSSSPQFGDKLLDEQGLEKLEWLHDLKFLPAEDISLIQNITRCSQFLCDFEDHQTLFSHLQAKIPPLGLVFTYRDAEKAVSTAAQYEASILTALKHPGLSSTQSDLHATFASLAVTEDTHIWTEDLDASILKMSALPEYLLVADKLSEAVSLQLSANLPHSSLEQPPISMIPHLSLHPFLTVQNRVLTSLTLRSILVDHKLQTHLEFVQDFFLCRSGVFTSLLKRALFSADVEAAERTKGVLRTGGRAMGMKLGTDQRREWPPTSSELSLALMGVLNESCTSLASSRTHTTQPSKTRSENINPVKASLGLGTGLSSQTLPDGLSFAIRTDLTDEEIERTLDTQSIYALDFLRLSYIPSPALSEVITTRSLDKYDQVFKLMLRMMRMQFVVEEMYRDLLIGCRGRQSARVRAQDQLIYSLRHRATHVITSLCSFFHASISSNMAQFRAKLVRLETQLAEVPDQSKATDAPTTLSYLASLHNHHLSITTSCLLLKKHQRDTAAVLEHLLGCILDLSRAIRRIKNQSGSSSAEPAAEVDLKQLHTNFNAAMQDFRESLRSMCGKMEATPDVGRNVAGLDQNGGFGGFGDKQSMDPVAALGDLLDTLSF